MVPASTDDSLRGDALAHARTLPRPLVFTNGVFDLLHAGHVTYLQAARALGASLVVGLNSDRSARGLGKGPGRPLVGEDDRALVVSALAAVSAVVLFDEPTPARLIDELAPDLYVKGGDYRLESLPEAQQVRLRGGRAMVLPYLPGRSSTGLLRAILAVALPGGPTAR